MVGAVALALLSLAAGVWGLVAPPFPHAEAAAQVTERLHELQQADARGAAGLHGSSATAGERRSFREARSRIDTLVDLLAEPPAWLDADLADDYRTAFQEYVEVHHAREALFTRLERARQLESDGGEGAPTFRSAAVLARVQAVLYRQQARMIRKWRLAVEGFAGIALCDGLGLLLMGILWHTRGRRFDLTAWWAGALEPMLLLDEAGRLLSANPAARRQLGVDAAQHGEPAERWVHADTRAVWRRRLAEAVEKQVSEPTEPAEVRVRREDGEWVPATFTMTGVHEGGRRGVLVHLMDRSAETSVEQLEETLRSSSRELTEKELELQITQARKAAIFSASLDGIVGLDEAWRIIEWNPATLRMFGYDEETLHQMRLEDLVVAASAEAACDRRVTEDGSTQALRPLLEVGHRVELCARRRDGTLFPAEVSVVRVEAAGPPLFTAYIVDISERKNVERIKNEFISIVSHELRTPLTSIRGSLGLLEGGVAGPLGGRARDLVRIARTNSDRLIRLINDMLDLEKMQSGKDELVLEPVSPADLVAAACAAVRGMAEEGGVTIVDEVLCDRPVIGDRDKLVRVATNLLSNAVKASPEGGEVRVCARETDGSLRISVTDHGEGIPEDQLPHLFDRFKRVTSPSFRKKQGTGLGLAISKTIMTQHHGTIEVHSRVGEGATFTMVVPFSGPSPSDA